MIKSIKSLRNKADREFQKKFVKENPRCLVCSELTSTMHHFILKSQSSYLRYSESNLIPLCFSCHFKIHHTNTAETTDKIIRIKGRDWADDLYSKKRIIFKMNKGKLKEIIEGLE